MENMVSVPYSSAIGSVMYTMICTRPDLAHSISLLSKYMSNPGRSHWDALKWLLRYIKGTVNEGLVYHSSKKGVELTGLLSRITLEIETRGGLLQHMYSLCVVIV